MLSGVAALTLITDQIAMAQSGWTPQESSRNWHGVTSSADGTKLVAVVAGGGQIYTSTDSGVTWTARESNRSWHGVASSADGTKLVAVVAGGQIYTSTDSGGTWTPQASNRSWHKCCFIGGRNKAGGGGSWRADLYIDRQRRDVDTAGEQSELVRCCFIGGRNKAGGGGKWRADLYIDRQRRDVDTAGEQSESGSSVASSADGTKLVAVVYGGQIYTSTDSGVTWTPQASNRNWFGVASSADGTKLVAVVDGGQIYTSTDSGVNVDTAGEQSELARCCFIGGRNKAGGGGIWTGGSIPTASL
jgi:ligand-binding sensor protein